jgi:hypothetical protein
MKDQKALIPIPEDFMFRLSDAEFENLKSHFATSSAGWGGRRCRNNLSMTSTRNNNMSTFCHFMDTFYECVHAVDMKKQVQSFIKPSRASLEDIGYGG